MMVMLGTIVDHIDIGGSLAPVKSKFALGSMAA
jgi:hypothetical protein